MAAADGPTPEHLSFLRAVALQARRYGLFPVLRGVEARAPAMPRIGLSRLPAQDIVEIAQAPSLSFAASTLESVEFGPRRPAVNGYWLGLTGPMGPLPLHLTEFVGYEQRYSAKRPFGRFLDLLSQRMLQFFYRAWADSQPAAHADRIDGDRFAGYIAALSGAAEGACEQDAFPRRARIHYAGLFASTRSAAGIEDGLAHLLAAPVRLLEYQNRWRVIELDDRTRLGRSFSTLGVDAVTGGTVKSVSDAFRVVIRTNSMREYEDFLPTGRRFAIAAEALAAFAPSHLEWDIELELDERQARFARLDGRARLGWTSWLAPRASATIRADAHLGRGARRLTRAEGKRTTR
jgi:type VI secretion system protein ImpH